MKYLSIDLGQEDSKNPQELKFEEACCRRLQFAKLNEYSFARLFSTLMVKMNSPVVMT
jgi:hypothetical protein